MIQFNIDFTKVAKTLKKLSSKKTIQEIHYEALIEVVKQMKLDVKDLTPIDTRELYDSWEAQKINDYGLEAGFNIIYAMYQHQGRRADGTHIIRNRPAGGETFFLKKTIAKNLDDYYQLYTEKIKKKLKNLI